MKKKIILILVVMFLLVSCGPADLDPVGVSIESNSYDAVNRVVDDEAGVVCYTFDSGSYAGGISCIPISQTRLVR